MAAAAPQITRVGLWYVLAGLVVSIAAVNTGNNGLFLTAAALAAAFVVSYLLAWVNVAQVEVEASADHEIFANSVSSLDASVRNRNRLLPSWLLLLAVRPDSLEPPERRGRRSRPWLVPHLAAGERRGGQLDLLLQRRGVRRLRFLELTSLFPLGLFRRQRRHDQDLEVLVYPEIYPASGRVYSEQGPGGDLNARRPGVGQELHVLRDYQPGDDPRAIHWKQSARQQRLIVQQRQVERSRRLRIVFDNAVGELEDEVAVDGFERLVSEAASAAVEALDRGYEVALLTRDTFIDYAAGERQRRHLLEALARVEALPEETTSLDAEPDRGLQLRLASSGAPVVGDALLGGVPAGDGAPGDGVSSGEATSP